MILVTKALFCSRFTHHRVDLTQLYGVYLWHEITSIASVFIRLQDEYC